MTKDRVRVVLRLAEGGVQSSVLAGADLACEPEECEAATEAYESFFNKHYEFYGRKLDIVIHYFQCDGSDPTCHRQDARNLVKKLAPFAVMYTGGYPPEFYDEMARLGVITFGGWMLSNEFNAKHRPYLWDAFASGTQAATGAAHYWCNKMRGKNTFDTGDATLRGARRKLGIVTADDEPHRQAANTMVKLVSGGVCGSSTEKPPVVAYTVGGDTARTQEQATTISVALRREGVTSIACVCDIFFPIFWTRALDEQNYFPEHLLAGVDGVDGEVAARLYSQTQWRNAFGGGHRPVYQPKVEDQDHHRAYHDANGPGEPRFVTSLFLLYFRPIAMVLQWAGPNLSPLTFERGAFEGPQIGGWQNPKPWPGWKCCNKYVQMIKFGHGDYNGNSDARQVWYDPSRTSWDGRPGEWVCVEDCRRYTFTAWPKGNPKQ